MLRQSFEGYINNLRNSKDISDCEVVPVAEITDEQDFLFISYSHRDYKKVYEDLAVMSQAGIKFWYDKGMRAGKRWNEEVKTILMHPRCVGVIFFISENLFLSKSVNHEIDLVCGNGGIPQKDYFSVNLTSMDPTRIIRAVMRMDDEVLDKAGLDTSRIVNLGNAFGDNQLYLAFSEANHHVRLVEEVQQKFPNAIDLFSTHEALLDRTKDHAKYRYLIQKKTQEVIPLNHSVFRIGRDADWADYCIDKTYVSREHYSIFCAEGEAWLLDHASRNGTYVNGRVIKRSKPLMLNDGDEISAANQYPLVFRVEMREEEWKESLEYQLDKYIVDLAEKMIADRKRSASDTTTDHKQE